MNASQQHWQLAQQMANTFWQQVTESVDISDDFKIMARQMQEKIASLTSMIARMA